MLQWLKDGDGSLNAAMTSQPDIQNECWGWLTLRGSGRWLAKLQRWSVNRPALLLASLSEAEEAILQQQEEEQADMEEALDAAMEEALDAMEAGDNSLMETLVAKLQAEEEEADGMAASPAEAATVKQSLIGKKSPRSCWNMPLNRPVKHDAALKAP